MNDMSKPDDDANMTDSKSLLNFSQGLRKQIVTSMVEEGLPKDDDDRKILLQALRDMDQTSIGRLRVDVEESQLQNTKEVQDIIAKISGVNPSGLRIIDGSFIRSVEPIDLPEVEVSEGEMTVGLNSEDAKTFIARMDDD